MKYKILWVEDKPDEVIQVIEMLRNDGHEVIHVPNRHYANQTLKEQIIFDLLILDEMMDEEDSEIEPKNSGFKLFSDLRNGRFGEWGKTAPVIFITGWSNILKELIKNNSKRGNKIKSQILEPAPLEIMNKPIEGNAAKETIIINLEIFKKFFNLFDDSDFYVLSLIANYLARKKNEEIKAGGYILRKIVKTKNDTIKTNEEVEHFKKWLLSQDEKTKDTILKKLINKKLKGNILKLLGFDNV